MRFRFAENAFLTATAARKRPDLPNREQELRRLFGEALKRYQAFADQHPEFAHANRGRFGLALCHYELGEFDKAAAVLAAIPQADRAGDLAAVPYLLADCIIRTLPAGADDALAAARLQQQLGEAIQLLDGFLAANPTSPHAGDALIKLGHCHQQVAALMADPQERSKALTSARQVYERLLQPPFAQHPAQPVAVFERAKCLAQLGDIGGAMNELGRFNADPLRNTPVAPLALLRLSALLRAQNRPQDAANLLQQCRAQHEPALLKDPARAELVPMLQYHHGLALKEAGKLAEARALFEAIVKQFAGRLEAAEAAWRAGQCRKEEALARIEAAKKALAKPGIKPEEQTAANQSLQEGYKQLRETAQYFQDQAGPLGQKSPGAEPHLRMFYEAAWCHRAVAEGEIEAARQKLQQEALKTKYDELAKKVPVGFPLPPIPPPDIPLAAVPVQPSETRARDQYKALIAAKPDAPLALVARFELAELHAQRGEHDPAIVLLTQTLEKEPPAELAEKVRLRLGACYLAKNDPAAAFGQFSAVARNPKSPLVAEARYRAGECLMQQGGPGPKREHWQKAVEYLAPFRDQPPLQNVPGVSDRALLRLGHAYAHLGQWDQSRQTLETLLQRFPQSPWVHEARYGIGWAWQNQKQYDQAVSAYTQVTNATVSEVAAKAQLQIGLCRLEQKRYAEAANHLLVVPFTYDYPDLSALALCEASRVFVEMKQPQQAAKLLERVLKDHPNSRWAELARRISLRIDIH